MKFLSNCLLMDFALYFLFKERVARPMYINLYHFIVLILIIHVLYDTRQENYYFIRKVIDKRTKINSKCCRSGGLNLCPLITSVFSELQILKVLINIKSILWYTLFSWGSIFVVFLKLTGSWVCKFVDLSSWTKFWKWAYWTKLFHHDDLFALCKCTIICTSIFFFFFFFFFFLGFTSI